MSLAQLMAELALGEDSEALAAKIAAATSELQNKQVGTGEWTVANAAAILTAVSEWILKFSASKRLSAMLNFCEKLLKGCHLTEEVNLLIEKEDIESTEGLFSAPFVSCLLSLLNSVLSSAKMERYSKLLLSLLRICSFTVHHSSLASALRRKGLLKQLLSLHLATLKDSAPSTESTRMLVHWLGIVLIKLAVYHEKCRDYLLRKGVVQSLLAFLSADVREPERLESVTDSIVFLGAMAGNSKFHTDDQQLMVWVANGVPVVLRYYQYAVENRQLEAAEAMKSACMYFCWRLSISNAELQVDLEGKGVVGFALAELSESTALLSSTTFAIGILRRVSANNDFKATLSRQVLEPIFNHLAVHSKTSNTLLLKEAIGCLGSIATEPDILPLLLEKNLPEVLIDIAVRNAEALKLVKTCLGALVNVSLSERTMERVASNALFYQLVEMVLERHGDSAYFLDYALRMVANVVSNRRRYAEMSLYHLSTHKTVTALVRALHCFPGSDNIVRYSLRILRTMLTSERGKETVLAALQGQENALLEDLFTAFDAQIAQIDIIIEAIHFLAAALSLPASPFLPLISSNPHFPKSMNACLSHYRVSRRQSDKEKLAVVTESLGALPVEDMGNPF